MNKIWVLAVMLLFCGCSGRKDLVELSGSDKYNKSSCTHLKCKKPFYKNGKWL